MIIQKLQKYDFSACSFGDRPHSLQNGFLICFRLSSPVTERAETEIFSIPNAVRATVRLMTIAEAGQGWGWNENYTSYPDNDGNVPVLETEIYLNVPYHPERTLIHELLHLKLCLLGESGNALQDRLAHQLIDDLADALYRAAHGEE